MSGITGYNYNTPSNFAFYGTKRNQKSASASGAAAASASGATGTSGASGASGAGDKTIEERIAELKPVYDQWEKLSQKVSQEHNRWQYYTNTIINNQKIDTRKETKRADKLISEAYEAFQNARDAAEKYYKEHEAEIAEYMRLISIKK